MRLVCLNGAVKMEGKVTFANVVDVRKQGEQHIQKSLMAQFDLAGIQQHDSSILALLIAWKRFALQRKVAISFTGAPTSLKALAKVCNLQTFLIN